MNLNNKAFTMVELLVAMAIVGLLIIMAFPTIRAIQTNNTKTKYKEYGKSVVSAAKIYTDSYAEDLFNADITNEFKIITLQDLVKKDLIKDINLSDSSCINGKSNVTVVKYKDDYAYCLHLYCTPDGDETKKLYEEENRTGSCQKFEKVNVKYKYAGKTEMTASYEIIKGDDSYIILHPNVLTGFTSAMKNDHQAFDNKWSSSLGEKSPGDKVKIDNDIVFTAKTHPYKYTIKYTTSGLTGVTGTMADTPCTYGVSCPLRTPVTFKKDYYTFDKWKYNSLEIPSNANLQTDFIAKNKLDITSDNQVINLTTVMRKNVLKVGYNSNGGSLQSAHSNRITLASNVIKVDNNAVHHTLNYDGKLTTDGLSNWNNTGWINLAKKGHTVKSGEEWNTAAAGNGKTFNQTNAYTAKELCPELKTGDCTKNMYVKWTLASYKCVAGKYLKKGDTFCTTCTSGNYCPGGTYTYNTSKDQGLTKCPSGYNKSASGSSKITQCYMEVSKNKYVKKAKDSSTTSCPSGYGKNVHNVYYNKTSSCIQKPTCSINATTNPYKGSWYKNNVIINLTRSGGSATSYGLATSKNSTNKQTSVTIKKEGTNTYYGYVSNEGGSSTCSKVIRIDKSPPTVVLYKNNEPAGGIAKDVCKPALESKGVNLKNYVFYDGIWFVWKDVYSGTTNYDGNCKSWLEWPSVFNNGRTTITSHLNSGTCRDSFPVNHKTNINELLCFRMRSKKAPGSFVVKYKLCDYVDNCVESSITYKVGT